MTVMMTEFFRRQLQSVRVIKKPASGWTASASEISVGTIKGVVTVTDGTLVPAMDTSVALQDNIRLYFSTGDFSPDGDGTIGDIKVGDIIVFNSTRYEISRIDFRSVLPVTDFNNRIYGKRA